MLSGDIESNPGPELSKIAKHLEIIAADIEDIKEARLVRLNIEKKLEGLILLEAKVESWQTQIESESRNRIS